MIDSPIALAIAPIFIGLICLPALPARAAPTSKSGVITLRSAYPFGETILRIEADVAKKKVIFFGSIEQAKRAAAAGVALRPSSQLVLGNPPLGSEVLTSNPKAGLGWPVRLLVTEDAAGTVAVHYTSFQWIARRHEIVDRDAAFDKASEVIASIASRVAAK